MIDSFVTSINYCTVKASTSEDPSVQPTTLSPTTVGGDMTDSTMIYPTTTMDNENIFTTDTVPMFTDFTTLDSSDTSQGEVTESEVLPLESRIGTLEDGVIKGGRSIRMNVGRRKYLSPCFS